MFALLTHLIGCGQTGESYRSSLSSRNATSNSEVPRRPDGQHIDEATKFSENPGWYKAVTADALAPSETTRPALPSDRDSAAASGRPPSTVKDALSAFEGVTSESGFNPSSAGAEFPPKRTSDDDDRVTQRPNQGDVFELLENRKIGVYVSGSGIDKIRICVRNLTSTDVGVIIPAGTICAAQNVNYQNMLITESVTLALSYNQKLICETVKCACMNMHKRIPEFLHNVEYIISKPLNVKDDALAKLANVLDLKSPTPSVRQAAVWILTDNANFSDLGTLVVGPASPLPGLAPPSPSVRSISALDAVNAMMIIDSSNIDITKKSIWTDRKKLVKIINDAELINEFLNDAKRNSDAVAWVAQREVEAGEAEDRRRAQLAREQLDAEQRAGEALKRAKAHLQRNELIKARQYLEEVVLISPESNWAREARPLLQRVYKRIGRKK